MARPGSHSKPAPHNPQKCWGEKFSPYSMQAALVQRDVLQSEGAVYHQMVLMESRGYCPRRRWCCRLPQVGEEAEVAGSLPCAWLGSFQDAADEAVA